MARAGACAPAPCATAVRAAGAAPSFEFSSPPLAEVVRDINKYSNNLMAQQLFLTLGLRFRGTARGSREVLQPWLRDKSASAQADITIDNGSGLSRRRTGSRRVLALLLQRAWTVP